MINVIPYMLKPSITSAFSSALIDLPLPAEVLLFFVYASASFSLLVETIGHLGRVDEQ